MTPTQTPTSLLLFVVVPLSVPDSDSESASELERDSILEAHKVQLSAIMFILQFCFLYLVRFQLPV